MTVNIDLACGFSPKSKWIGLDIRKECKPHVVCDFSDGIPLKDSCVDEVNCSNFIEHLKPEDCKKFVKEIIRVCKIGSIVVVAVPSYDLDKTYVPEHLSFHSDCWLSYSRFSNEYFNVEKVIYPPSDLWESGEVQKLIPGITHELARKLFRNMTKNIVFKLIVKKKIE